MVLDIYYIWCYTHIRNKEGTQKGETKMFENTLKESLIRTYVETFGQDAWTEKTEEQKTETLHELLGSFLTVAKKRAQ